jgi:hypothetical protein
MGRASNQKGRLISLVKAEESKLFPKRDTLKSTNVVEIPHQLIIRHSLCF